MVERASARRKNKGVPPVRLDSAAEWERCMDSCQYKKDDKRPRRDVTDADARKSPPRQQQETPRNKKPKGPKSLRCSKTSKSRKRWHARSLGTQTDPVELGIVSIRHTRDHATAVDLEPEGSCHEETFRLERPTTAALAPAGVESILPPEEDGLIAPDDSPTSCERALDEPTSACKKRKGSRGREADKSKRRAMDPTSSVCEENPPGPVPDSSAVKDGTASMMEEIERQRAMLMSGASCDDEPMPSPDEAKFEELKLYAQSLDLNSPLSWYLRHDQGNLKKGCPRDPEALYEDHWTTWCDFLTASRYCSFYLAKDFAMQLELDSHKQWRDYCKYMKMPATIPDNPDEVYAVEWRGWHDFLQGSRTRHNIFKPITRGERCGKCRTCLNPQLKKACLTIRARMEKEMA